MDFLDEGFERKPSALRALLDHFDEHTCFCGRKMKAGEYRVSEYGNYVCHSCYRKEKEGK